MNQTQRKFLIDKINEKVKITDKLLKESLPEEPDLASYLLAGIIGGTTKIKSSEALLEVLKQRALKNTSGWLSRNSWSSKNDRVEFRLEEFFDIPKEYLKVYEEWKNETKRIEESRKTLLLQTEGLCTRIQLASNKTLEKMIAEVDDMGDISLVDVTLKSLMTDNEQKILSE